LKEPLSSRSSRGPDSEARGGGPQPLERPEDPAREQQGADQRGERGGDRDREDLRVVVHPEHDPARGEDDGERQADGEQGQRRDLEAQRRQEPHRRRERDPRREDAEAEEERDDGHDRSR